LFKAFPKRRELFRGLLAMTERPTSADPEIRENLAAILGE
jgi:hypothetical protein